MSEIFEDTEEAWFNGGCEWYNKERGVTNPNDPRWEPCIMGDFDPYVFWAETESTHAWTPLPEPTLADYCKANAEKKERKRLQSIESLAFCEKHGIVWDKIDLPMRRYEIGDWVFYPGTMAFHKKGSNVHQKGHQKFLAKLREDGTLK